MVSDLQTLLQRQRKWSHLRPCACADIPTPCMQGSCREAVLGWLWTLAGANEPRSAGGEKGVLRDEATLPGAPPARPRAACAPHRTMLFPQTFCKCSLCTLCGPPGGAQHCPSPHRLESATPARRRRRRPGAARAPRSGAGARRLQRPPRARRRRAVPALLPALPGRRGQIHGAPGPRLLPGAGLQVRRAPPYPTPYTLYPILP